MEWIADQILRDMLGWTRAASVVGAIVALCFFVNLLLSVRIIYQKGTRPNAALAWIATLFAMPVIGLAIYIVIGENRIAVRRRRRHARIVQQIHAEDTKWDDPQVLLRSMSTEDMQLAHLAERLDAPPVLNGNLVQISGDPKEQADWMVQDIDAACESVHICFYIYEDDATGRIVSDALVRAAARGVRVRLLLDGIGSRSFLRSAERRRLEAAGVRVVEALPATFMRMLIARIDIRNHRKLIVVDGCVAQTGSRNIADPDFRSGGRLGKSEPYVDSWVRLRGPVVRDLQLTFCEDWELDAHEPHAKTVTGQPAVLPGGVAAQAIPSGPNFPNAVVPELIQASIQLARREVCLSTPYFIPDDATLSALEVAARRGLRVTLILPDANDSLLASYASRAHFAPLLEAGVEIWEFRAGFLHSKTVLVDDAIAIVTTANVDRRSYEINFENSIVVYDHAFAGQLRTLQMQYLSQSTRLDPARWAKRGRVARFTENFANLVSPLL